MTRKEEIREAALNWKKVDPTNKIINALCDYILELTTPESPPEKEVGAVIYSFGYEASQSSPAPLESQEELWSEFIETFDSSTNKLADLKSKFILTRRKEEKP